MIIFLTFLVLIAAIIFEHLARLKKHDWIWRFPGPNTTLPVVGDALQFLGHPSTLRTKYRLNFQKYGSTWRFWFMSKPSLVTADPNLVKKLLGSNDHLEKHFIYEKSAKLIFREYGLITSSAHQWKTDRKLMNKVFNHDLLELSFNFSIENWKRVSEELLSDNEGIQCRKVFRKHFLATFVMSNDIADVSLISGDMQNLLCEAFDEALDLLNKGIMKPWTLNPVIWKLSGSQSKHSHVYDFFSSYAKSLIMDSVSKKESKLGNYSGELTEQPADNLKQGSPSLPKLFIDPSIPLNWKIDHLITLAATGTDTTALASTMTLFFLALNPESQKRAQEEIDSYFEVNERLRFGDISKLKCLKMCVKEAMRLHAPAPLIGRTTTEAILLEDGRKIPKGTPILVLLDEMNMNPAYFPDPLKFDPERFSETNVKDIPSGAFIPFSTGPRNCIGYKYSECVLIPVLALTLRHFSVHTNQRAEDVQLLYEVAGTPYPEVEIMFRKRSI